MSCLGGLRAVTKEEVDKLRAVPRAERGSGYLDVTLKQEDSCELWQAWDAIHRALTNGKLEYGSANAPGCWVILGGELLYGNSPEENDYIITCKSPDQVRQAAQLLQTLTEEKFRELYFAIDADDYGMTPDEDDFGFTWGYLEESIEFWKNAAERKLWVLFDASQ